MALCWLLPSPDSRSNCVLNSPRLLQENLPCTIQIPENAVPRMDPELVLTFDLIQDAFRHSPVWKRLPDRLSPRNYLKKATHLPRHRTLQGLPTPAPPGLLDIEREYVILDESELEVGTIGINACRPILISIYLCRKCVAHPTVLLRVLRRNPKSRKQTQAFRTCQPRKSTSSPLLLPWSRRRHPRRDCRFKRRDHNISYVVI